MSIKIISFDIGIKNLAYCIFEISEEKKCKILDWNVLDISKEEKTTDIFCSCILSKKNIKCNKKAKYYKNEDYYCESHAKKTMFFLPSSEINKISLKKISLEKILELEIKYFPEIKIEYKETKIEKIERITKQIQNNSLISIIKNKTSNDLISIGRNLYNQLILLKDLDNIEYVLIENQISPIANKMKTIQGMLAQIFIIRNVPNIEFISSINKLRGFQKKEDLEKEEKEKIKGKNPNYKQHKLDGIQYCKQWLQSDYFCNCSWNDFFDKYPKKQDDLADSFLQGIWFLQKINILQKK